MANASALPRTILVNKLMGRKMVQANAEGVFGGREDWIRTAAVPWSGPPQGLA